MPLRMCTVPFEYIKKAAGVRGSVWYRLESWGLSRENLLKEYMSGVNYTITYRGTSGIISVTDPSKSSGCYGYLQRNQSDFLAFPSTINLPDILVPLSVVDQKSISLLSTYKMQEQDIKQETKVMDFVKGFEDDLWIVTFTTILLFALLISLIPMVFGKKQRFNNSILWLMAAHVKQAGSLPLPRVLKRTLSLLLIIQLFAFLIGFFLTSMIKTESVVYRKPIGIVDRFEDMIRLKMRPIMYGYDNTQRRSRTSSRDSLMRRHYELSVKMGLDESLILTRLVHYKNHVWNLLRGREAIIVDSFDSLLSSAAFCVIMRSADFLSEFIDGYTWISRQHDDNAWTTSMVMRWDADQGIRLLLTKRFMHMMQQDVLTFHKRASIANLVTMMPGKSSLIHKCMSNIIQYPDKIMASLEMKHYRDLFMLLLIVSSCLPALCLVIEVICKTVMTVIIH